MRHIVIPSVTTFHTISTHAVVRSNDVGQVLTCPKHLQRDFATLREKGVLVVIRQFVYCYPCRRRSRPYCSKTGRLGEVRPAGFNPLICLWKYIGRMIHGFYYQICERRYMDEKLLGM